MYKRGIVSNIDEKTARVRVKFPDLDNLLSGWIPVIYSFTGKDKAYYLPSLDEQVACVMDENLEDGCVIGSLYSDQDKPPVDDKNKFHIEFEDGTFLEYDKQEQILAMEINGIASLKALQILLNGNDVIQVFNNHIHPAPNGMTDKPTVSLK